ncbi:hypothetical protein GCM10025783_20160 [Amnibacterium soli]|uniref:GAF domain-containing protein n=1 Tax=Amnibacterium soli TaxID=1282736 RepID=A0ABP8Z6N4_9MICO
MTIQRASTSVRRPADGRRHALPVDEAAAPARPADRRDDLGLGLRILFVGTGLDHGWNGGRRHAPTAAIAASVRAITGRSCELDLVGDPTADGEAVAEDLHARAGRHYDGAVVAVGAADAMRLTPVADWGARIVDLVDVVQAALPAGAPVLLVGAPAVHVPTRVQPLNPIALRHAARLDRVAHRLAQIRADVTYLPAPPLAKLVGRRAGGDLHAAFSLPIASAFAKSLRDRAAAVAVVRPAPGQRVDRRVLVDAARTGALSALTDLVRRAADEFGVAEAAISLFDGERRWRITNHGSGPAAETQSLTCCETVVTAGEPLVVAVDAAPCFPAQARAGLPVPVFYAGIPVHAEDGSAVGALCLVETDPRLTGSVDVDRLRDFAHEAERVLRAATAGPLVR